MSLNKDNRILKFEIEVFTGVFEFKRFICYGM